MGISSRELRWSKTQKPCQDGPYNEIPIAGLGLAVGTLRITGSEFRYLLSDRDQGDCLFTIGQGSHSGCQTNTKMKG